jgi:hypothetical protein
MASSTNCMNDPTLIAPDCTSRAPIQTTPVTPANISAMMIPVSHARAPIRASAAWKASSIADRNRPSRSFSMP